MSTSVAKLSCEQCQSRKKKCDKRVPCGSCQQAGIACTAVQRQRLPRGRSAHAKSKEASLKARVKRLESVVLQLQSTPADAQGIDLSTLAIDEDRELQDAEPLRRQESGVEKQKQKTDAADLNRFIAPSFWAELSDAISGLRGVIEEDDEDGLDDSQDGHDGDDLDIQQQLTDGASDANTLLFPTIIPFIYGNADVLLQRPPDNLKFNLLGIYHQRVDVIFKVLHWPTTYSLLANPGTTPLSNELSALEHCVCFMALCTLGDHEVNGRKELVERYRIAAELSLARVRVLGSTRLVVLQAFIIYLVGLRTCAKGIDAWTLTATAVRIGSAQGLDLISSTSAPDHSSNRKNQSRSLLELEVQKRVWAGIGIFDLQASFDRGSRFLLTAEDLERCKPMNIDDDELSSPTLSDSELRQRGQDLGRFTDMSACLMIWKAMNCQRRIVEFSPASILAANSTSTPGSSPPPATPNSEATDRAIWDAKISILREFEEHGKAIVRSRDADPNPSVVHRYCAIAAEEIALSMHLLLRRPMHKVHYAPPPADDKFDVLDAAITVLETDDVKKRGSDYYPWAWQVWTPWYALAIALAELCGRRPGSSELVERAWLVVQDRYDRYAAVMADSESGRLWKPIARLRKKVGEIRREAELASQGASMQSQQPLQPLQQQQQQQQQHQKPHSYSQPYPTPPDFSPAHFDSTWPAPQQAPTNTNTTTTTAPANTSFMDPLMSMPMGDAAMQHAFAQDPLQQYDDDAAFQRSLAGMGAFDPSSGDAMSMFNWNLFIDDVNNQGSSPDSQNS